MWGVFLCRLGEKCYNNLIYYEEERCKVKEHLERMIKFWKEIWGKLIAFIICGSIVALFIASFCLDKELTLSIMNEWVSLVVGMAALVLGIISLFLSFYNVEQSNDVQRETVEIMNNVKEDIVDRISVIEKKIDTGFVDDGVSSSKVTFSAKTLQINEDEENV